MEHSAQQINQIIVASFVMPLLLAAILIWFVISYQKRKNKHEIDKKDHLLQQQQLIIEKQKAVESERNRIATEMHDDLGSGLTTIKYLSERAKKIINEAAAVELISRIEDNARELVNNMSEIIWTMNTRYDDVANLAGFVRTYAFTYLENYEKELKFHIDESCGHQEVKSEARRDLFLVIKELLHNTVKHSSSDKIYITMMCTQDLDINIEEEGGRGFDPAITISKGNGIFNINKRLENIGGKIEFQLKPYAMTYRITYPLTKI